jgi:anti-sigma B factor antagonist
MQLKVENARIGNVVVLRCVGRIVTGDEVRSLQEEVEKHTLGTKKVVLNLAQVNFVDSGGLGALVRMKRVLRATQGDLVLCHLCPFLVQALEATTLHRFFQPCASEAEAVQSFSMRSAAAPAEFAEPQVRIVCAHRSADLLAYISALLRHAGYEVHTASTLADARTLVIATRPDVFIHAAEVASNDPSLEKIRQIDPKRHFVQLPHDFLIGEASRTGTQLVERIRSLLEG